ncbi:hypothetical protein B0H10DRAFT_1940528 [Mycena sp. CBHHK59/15]|nr:hypothetical protein B0H10DRAFT_1940528 [Mycena sp. CBHHK59/15]
MGNFEWSTPSRRIGGRPLSIIPNEVYLEIFDYFQPSEETSFSECKLALSKIALVCRFFCAAALSRIYQSLEFSGTMGGPGYGPFCRLLNQMDSSSGLSSNPDVRFAVDVANFVKECTFKDWKVDPSNDILVEFSSAILKIYCNAVTRMPEIRSIHLESTPITKSLIHAIVESRCTLKTLCIRSCTVDPKLTKKHLKKLLSLRLTALEFFETSSTSIALPPDAILVRDLEIFRTDSWAYGLYFIKRTHPFLRVLELDNVVDLSALHKFLAVHPTITDLTINSIVIKSEDRFGPFLTSTLPNIQRVKIPPSFLSHFRKRPLREVSLMGAEFRDWDSVGLYAPTLPLRTNDNLAPLAQSTTSIISLQVPQHVYFAFPLHKGVKNLEILTLSYHHPNFSTIPLISSPALFRTAIQSICTKWPESPPLREFRMDFGETRTADSRNFMWDLQLQHEMISSELHVPFPHVTHVSFARFIKWQRCDERSTWRVFVPHPFRSFVKDKLAGGQPVTDFGGCFAALYCT